MQDPDLKAPCLVGPRFRPPRPRVCVIFATRGRPSLLAEAVAEVDRQSLRPWFIIVSCPTREDAGAVADRPDVTLVTGCHGLAAQRNAGLDQVPHGTELVVFFDDDFLPRRDWIAAVAALFSHHPDIGAVTGTLIADGIKGPGLSIAAARRLVTDASVPSATAPLQESYTPYGCNMAFRTSAIAGRRFDERLVLYGWLEDRDFGAALERRGYRVVKTPAALGVHLGAKVGRVSGRRLGYSQVINPLYLFRKGTMPLRAVADHLFRNLVSNLVRAFAPEPFIDRRGRLRGNLRAFRDLACGVLQPERAADL
jgi:GT2 family glycosyltransferase